MLGATAFEGVACNSSPDICASDDFARMGLTPAPSRSRLKSRRFMTLPHSCAYLLMADSRQPTRPVYSTCVVKRKANIHTRSHLRNDAVVWQQHRELLPKYGMALKSASFRPLTGELFNYYRSKSDMALATLPGIKKKPPIEGGLWCRAK